ncbi:MAG TPA: DUF1349 domain-containing protein [Sedimentisphaerales bacterium]|nr:DUF1349 domain-containing protein [Sedimentisphaerales bacterium]
MCKRRLCIFPLLLVLSLTWPGEAQSDDPTLAAWWRLDEGGGTKATDSSGKGNDGTLNAGAAWTAGVSKTGVYLDGVDDYIEVPNVLTEDGTVAFWFKPDWDGSDPEDYRIFDASLGGIYFFISKGANHTDITPDYFGFYLEDAADTDYQAIEFDPDGVLFADTWFHIAVTWEFGGGPAVLYLDGNEMARAASLGAFPALNPNLRFGYETFTYIPIRHGAMGVIDEIMIYNRALAAEEIPSLMVTAPPEIASDPRPADEATDVPRDVVLGWGPGAFAAAHDVYFGTSFDDVNAASRANPRGVLVSQGQTAASYDPPGVLDFATTYYWRIDEVNAPPDSTIFKGAVWSFTAEPLAYPVANIVATSNGIFDADFGPENTINGSGLNAAGQHSIQDTDMWAAAPGAEPLYIQYEFDRVYKLHQMLVWNYNSMFELVLGFGLKSVTVEYSENGADWTALGDFEFARATAKATYTANTTVDFGGVPARFVRLNVNSGYGMMGQFGLSEVRFLYIPAHAREPQPADGATDVEVGMGLAWRSGREAVRHDVYVGMAPDALNLAGTVDSPAFVAALEFGRTYYWRVDEVNEADATPVWSGDVWSFATQQYALIDGFETYNDDLEAGTAIFDTWLDGWINATGSIVGYFNAPFAEQTIIHAGRQSMPLQYDNTKSPFYSEAWREFETAQNWTGNGADRLVLYVRGNAPAFVEQADGQIIMSAIGTDIWDTSDQFRYAYKSLSGNGSITVRVDSLIRSNEWAKAGVMIRETLEPGSKHAFMALTPEPAHGGSFQRRPVAGQASANTDVANISLPHWVRLTRTGNTFTAHYSADGVTWTAVVVSPAVEITMASNVYIGLAVCSHDAAIVTAAEFSNVSMTGGVTGAWQTAEIGVAQPVGNATAEPMYVRIEDAAGKTATVVNADASINQRPSWQEWSIPYSELSGVNLGRVKKMVIGVGSKTSPKAGGAGTVYVDDIGYGRPAAP